MLVLVNFSVEFYIRETKYSCNTVAMVPYSHFRVCNETFEIQRLYGRENRIIKGKKVVKAAKEAKQRIDLLKARDKALFLTNKG